MSDNFLRKLLNVCGKECLKKHLTYSECKENCSLEKQKAPLCRRSFSFFCIKKRVVVANCTEASFFMQEEASHV